MEKIKREYLKRGSSVIHRGRQIVILSCIAILALLCSVWNAASMKKGLEDSTREYGAGITGQMVGAIRDGINNKKTELENVADSLFNVYEKDEGEAMNEFLERKARILDFNALILIDEQGNCHSDFMEADLNLDVQALIALEGVQDSFQGNANMGFFEGQSLFYSAPVRTGSEIAHVLIGVRSKENMQSVMESNAFDGKTLSCMVDSHGEVVLSPVDLKPFIYLDSIFQNKTHGREAENFQKMQKDMADGVEGMIQFTDIKGGKNLLSYNPLGINDWILLTILPVDLISGSTSIYMLRSLLIVVGISLVFLLFLMMLYRIYTENRSELSRMAFVDSVTGGMNYTAFQLYYERAVRELSPFGCAVVFLNIRNFKMVNDKLGFSAGNEILRYLYRVLERHMDEDNHEFAARSEMDHFFLCMKESEPEAVRDRLHEIIQDINSFQDTTGPGYQLSFIQGCCLVDDRKLELHTVQDRARVAAQEAVSREQDGCVFFDDQIAERIRMEQELDAMFEGALARKEFQVYLQPKVNLKTGRPDGAEALVRWVHPERGLIPPAEFVPLFEKNGKICRLDFYVFEEVCRFFQKRQKEGRAWYPVSVNLSRYHFYEEDFLDKFYRTYQEYGLPKNSIEFELTESMFFNEEHIECIKKGIQRMHEMGFKCSMDDFGFGYSSLGLLKEFDVDTLKLDRSFFLDISSIRARDIIRSVVELASRLNVETVAEGIEQTEQMDFLYSINCDTVQGYFFSRPLPIHEFEDWLSQYEMRQ